MNLRYKWGKEISLLTSTAKAVRAAQTKANSISAKQELQKVMKTNLGPEEAMKMLVKQLIFLLNYR